MAADSITVKESQSGDDYSHIPEVIVVYISEFDFLKGGKTIYHVDRVLRETGKVIDDGQHEIFVNTVVNDGTDIADLMRCFMQKQIDSPRFPVITDAVKRLKNTEGGASAVCEVMQKYEAIAREQGIQEGMQKGIQKGIQKGKIESLVGAVKSIKQMFGVDNDTAFKAAAVPDEYREAVLAAL